MLAAGKTLREERERRELSLETIAKTTKISVRTLAAIENDQVSFLQTPFLYKSFVKQYAESLHLEYSLLAEAVDANVSEIPIPLIPGQENHAPDIAPIRSYRRGTRWTLPLLSLIAVMVACSALYALIEHTDFPRFATVQRLTNGAASEIGTEVKSTTSSQGAGPQAKEPAGKAGKNPPAHSTPADAHAAAETRAPGVPGEDIFLRIAAVERTWLSIEADGKSVYSGLLQPEDTKMFEGHDTAKIRTGNAGGLTVTFNGKELGRLGERGQVRTVLFTRDQYEILQPNLTSRLELLPIARVSEQSTQP